MVTGKQQLRKTTIPIGNLSLGILAVEMLRMKPAYQKASGTPVAVFAWYIDMAISGEL
jgi:hypothetical protein